MHLILQPALRDIPLTFRNKRKAPFLELVRLNIDKMPATPLGNKKYLMNRNPIGLMNRGRDFEETQKEL
jgi:hypothetical protein